MYFLYRIQSNLFKYLSIHSEIAYKLNLPSHQFFKLIQYNCKTYRQTFLPHFRVIQKSFSNDASALNDVVGLTFCNY